MKNNNKLLILFIILGGLIFPSCSLDPSENGDDDASGVPSASAGTVRTLDSIVTTRYFKDGKGNLQPYESWQWTDETETEVAYYALYDYDANINNTKETIYTGYNFDSVDPLAAFDVYCEYNYKYEDPDYTHGASYADEIDYYADGSSKKVGYYDATYNSYGNYTSFIYYVLNEKGELEVDAHRTADYYDGEKDSYYEFDWDGDIVDQNSDGNITEADLLLEDAAFNGAYYKTETYYYGEGETDDDIYERYECTYDDIDGDGAIADNEIDKYVQEIYTHKIRGTDGSIGYSEVFKYEFQWNEDKYCKQENKYEKYDSADGSVGDQIATVLFDCDELNGKYLTVKRTQLSEGELFEYTTYTYNSDGELLEEKKYDFSGSNGARRITSLVSIDYSTQSDGMYYTETSYSYEYPASRSVSKTKNGLQDTKLKMPKFHH